jgi:hypothetical protein
MKTIFLFLVISVQLFSYVFGQSADSCYVLQITKHSKEKIEYYPYYFERLILFPEMPLSYIHFDDGKSYNFVKSISKDSISVCYYEKSQLPGLPNPIVTYPISAISKYYIRAGRLAKPKRYKFEAVKLPAPCVWDGSEVLYEQREKLQLKKE